MLEEKTITACMLLGEILLIVHGQYLRHQNLLANESLEFIVSVYVVESFL